MATLFSRLSRLAKGQRENFHTELLAVVLETARDHEPDLFSGIVSWLGIPHPGPSDEWSVHTQARDSFGITDLELLAPGRHLIVEVKVSAGVHGDQLPRYRGKLDVAGAGQSALAILSVLPVPDPEAEHAQVKVLWSEICVKIESFIPRATDPVCAWMLREFVKFLHEGKLVMGGVDKSLTNGVVSLMNLLAMMKESLSQNRISHSASIGANYSGFYVDGKAFWVGVSFALEDTMIRWANEQAWVDSAKVADLGVGKMVNADYWRYWLDLSDFFDLDKGTQQRRVDEFIRAGWAAAEAIRIPTPDSQSGKSLG